MALEEFEKEQLTENEKRYIQRRSIMDYGMGITWMVMGFFLMMPATISPRFAYMEDTLYKWMGGIFILYGLFRIYRGYKKNYLRER